MTALNERTAALVRITAALAARNETRLVAALRAAIPHASGLEVEEALLQSYLFLGYPAALNALASWRALGQPASTDRSPEERSGWPDRGARVCESVYGGQYEGLRSNIRSLHPDMEEWMVHEGYGKVLGRAGLDLPTRELCIVSQLTVLDVPRQLYSHLRGALNVGASPEAVDAALHLGLEYASADAGARATATWTTLLGRREA